MAELFLQWFHDPVVQGLLLSPLIGAVMGFVLTAMVQPPSSSAHHSHTVSETRIIFRHEIEVQRGSRDDGSWLLPAAAILVFVLTWSYARYAEVGIAWWATLTLTFISFNLAAAVVAMIKKELLGAWMAYVALPLVALLISLWLAARAKQSLIPGAMEAAAQYGIVDFYLSILNHSQRYWLLTQGLGVLVGVAATLLAAGRLTHYVALSNQRGSGWPASIWRQIARFTRRAAGGMGLFFAALLYVLSAVLISGFAYGWLVQTPRVGG